MFIGSDDTFSPLADAEPIVFSRFDLPERGAGSGVDFFFEPWRAEIIRPLPAAVAAAVADY
jgi:hypothetical protein